jgi:putative FmdB family regulatory protein
MILSMCWLRLQGDSSYNRHLNLVVYGEHLMPIYEYQCASCHHTFDLMQNMNDEHAKLCPECSKETAVRLVSAAGFQLKGTGWYATDFKDKTGKNSTSNKKETNTTRSETKSVETVVSSNTTKGD